MRSRRRRSVAIAAFACVAAGTPLAWSIGALGGGSIVEAAVNDAKSLADLLSERSPGDRTQAQLTKTKHVRPSAKTGAPAPVFRRGMVPAEPTAPAELVMLLMPAPLPVDLGTPSVQSDLGPPPLLSAILGSSPGNPPNTPPGTGGPASFPTSEPREPLAPPSAVPEPGTWATMLLGFGLMGWRLRRRRSARQQPSAV
ncbi:MAG: PEPxxWA-CTERM sorting domain-containing protein [Sphingomonas sp.]